MKLIEVATLADVEAKQAEVSVKVAEYQAAQAHQLEHGGPGPVADYDIMSIVNEHNGEFEIVAQNSGIVEEPIV